MIRKMLACLSFLVTGLLLSAQEKGIAFVENTPWKEILAQSAAENKLIFLDCYTTWCGPCKAMAKEVFPLPEVGSFMNAHFINVKQDMEKGEGIELMKKYKKFIPGFPTYLLINGSGEVVHQVAGYNAAPKFLSKINDGLEQRSWLALSHAYEKGQRDWSFVSQYLALLEDGFQSKQVQDVTAEVLPAITVSLISADSAAQRIFRKYWTNVESPVLTTYLSSPGIYRKYKDPERDVNDWGGRLYKRAIEDYIKTTTADTAKAAILLGNLYKLHITGRENMIALLQLNKATQAKNIERFASLAQSAQLFGLLRNDERTLSNWARTLAETTTDKNKLALLLKSMADPDKTSLAAPDTFRNYAFVLDKMGSKQQADLYNKKATETEAEFKKKYEAFMKKSK